jgi:dihydrofolate reductase
MIVSLIVAVAENGVIGRDGAMPWKLSSDLKRFRALTLGKPVVMGRKTWESIGKPLQGRDNIVVTRDAGWSREGAHRAGCLDAALALAEALAAKSGATECMIIGGAEIYRLAMPRAARAYLTIVHARPDGDARLDIPGPPAWREVSREEIAPGPRDEHAHTFMVLERVA